MYAYASGIHISKTKVLLISRGSRLLRCCWFAEYVFLVIDGSVVYIYTRYILYLFCCSLFLSFSRCNWYSIWCLQYFGWVGDLNAGYGSLACIKRLAFTVSYNSSQPSCVFKLPVWRNILVMEHPNSQHQGYSFFFLHLADKGDRKRWGAVGFFRKSLNRTPENCVHVMPRAVNNDFSWSGWCGIFASTANQIRNIRDIPHCTTNVLVQLSQLARRNKPIQYRDILISPYYPFPFLCNKMDGKCWGWLAGWPLCCELLSG